MSRETNLIVILCISNICYGDANYRDNLYSNGYHLVQPSRQEIHQGNACGEILDFAYVVSHL